MLDAQSGVSKSAVRKGGAGGSGLYAGGFGDGAVGGFTDSGGASRFFYVAKASRRERNAGLEGMPEMRTRAYEGGEIASAKTPESLGGRRTAQNHHPTVKPIKLMEYLCRLVCPPGGTVLDPFMGSGTTGCAAAKLGFNFIGIEREQEYIEIAKKRIEHHALENHSQQEEQLCMQDLAGL